MSYSNDVKQEIISNYQESSYNDMIKTASYIYGYILCGNKLYDDNNITISSKNSDVVHFLSSLLKKYNVQSNISKKGDMYEILVLASELYNNIVGLDKFDVHEKSFLCGMFLANGRISDPKKEYNMEIRYILENEKYIMDILKDTASKFKYIKDNTVKMYTKNSDDIADILAYLELSKSLMRFENIRVGKEVKNAINRQVNIEVANLSKSILSSKKQIDAITYIQENNLEEELTEKQKEIARLRKKYPEKTLSEISSILGISKSTASTRMKGIYNVVENHKKEKRK